MISSFLSFIQKSPSAFHAVDEICRILEANGFEKLNEMQQWTVQPGGKYYVTRNLSSVIALTIPQSGMGHFQIVSSHSDSPMFKVKPVSEDVVCGRYLRLNTERYGGMIMSSWFDRPLSIAGRILVRKDGKLQTKLVDLGRDAAIIPNMPIHFNREVNDGYKFNAQSDMLPLYAESGEKGRLMGDIAEAAGVDAENIAGSDLFLYNRMPGSHWDEYISCPRIDDLECAWTSLQAFLSAKAEGHINVCAVFDNEEVGSSTKQGADSTFLTDVLSRVSVCLGATDGQFRAAAAASFMVSADNAHAVHPNHPEKYDMGNRTFMNGGVVIKHNANQKYTTDGVSAAVFASVCEKAGVPVQHFANRSDVLGGSTLGNIANTHLSMNTVDIGLAQLAMHSAYETAGAKDIQHMVDALTAFYSTDIRFTSDGAVEM
ncbi:MAG: M18 family aminopeptidase [Clostridia bacterium]|nr:M18 family aminopeptidase [Clostridia bacterium]